jgi:hypothetical protein
MNYTIPAQEWMNTLYLNFENNQQKGNLSPEK